MPHRYVFRVDFADNENRERFIQHWKKGSALIQTLPGARGTRLHSMQGGTSLMAIAEWDSKILRDDAMKILHDGTSEVSKKWLDIPRNEDFGKVTILGEIDEIGFIPPSHD
jgi:hypothetical protein